MRNKEHYSDPTAGQAERNIRREKIFEMMAREQQVKMKLSRYLGYKEALLEAQAELTCLLAEKHEYIADIGLPSPAGMQGGGSGISDPTYNKAHKAMLIYDRKIKRAKESIKAFSEWIAEIDTALIKLKPAERYILQERYMKLGKPTSFEEIALKLNYSVDHCKKMSRQAVNKLAIVLFKEG